MKIFDISGIYEKQLRKQLTKMGFYDDPIYSPRFKKIIETFSFKVMPVVLNIVSFILLIWIFNRIVTNYGIERLVAVLGAIFVMSLRSKSKTDKHK